MAADSPAGYQRMGVYFLKSAIGNRRLLVIRYWFERNQIDFDMSLMIEILNQFLILFE